jgi:predicted ATPase/class 3 adenylate cyclase
VGQPTQVPSGIVAFLFSDIEGSTQRWERDREAMTQALRLHDRVVRSAIEAAGGYVFKTVGDAFCAAFFTAGDAVAGSLAMHRGLAAADFQAVDGIRVRAAIHVGTADERDGDYFGPTLNRVSRLQATAWGGQTILSAAAAELARPELPPEATLLDLGTHRLKDLAEPESIAQLVVPDLPSEFPALRSLDASRNNLPTQLMPLIGREDVVEQIGELVSEHRLVTIVGTGGIGKTRTALGVAASLVDRFPGGVWYVELAPVASGSQVAAQIAMDLGLRETPGRSVLETVQLWLLSRSALLLIDNCEQVVAEAAQAIDAILRRCPGTKILATSREPLGMYGEQVMRLPTLRVPPAVGTPASGGATLTAEEALGYESVALFVERARAADPNFVLADAHASVVADICRRLDGIALAIELAASRVRMLTLPQLASKLDERFRLLTGGRREATPRQATLHAMITWSYELLEERERVVLERLGVFMANWSLEAAAEVCRDETLDEFETLDAIEALANKSLVAIEGDSDAKSYRLLESTRAFALLKLRERGAEREMRARHAAYALRVAATLDVGALETPSAAWERQAIEASADLRAAIAWALHAENDVPLGILLVATLRWYWSGLAARDGQVEVRDALEAAQRTSAPRDVIARLELAAATIATVFADYPRQLAAAERALALLEAPDDRLDRAIATRAYAQALWHLGRGPEAKPVWAQALAEFRELDSKRFIALTLDSRGMQRLADGDILGARADLEEAIALAADVGFERAQLFFDVNLGEIEFSLGNVGAAIALAERAVRRTYAMHEPATLAISWSNLGMYYSVDQRWDDAIRAAGLALNFARESDLKLYEAYAMQTMGAACAARGEFAKGARLLGFVDAQIATLSAERGETENAQYARFVALIAAGLGAEELEALRAEGSTMTQEQAERVAMPESVAAGL